MPLLRPTLGRCPPSLCIPYAGRGLPCRFLTAAGCKRRGRCHGGAFSGLTCRFPAPTRPSRTGGFFPFPLPPSGSFMAISAPRRFMPSARRCMRRGPLTAGSWSLMLIVTIKYVALLMRADNQGEGGTLSLLALAERGLGGRRPLVLALGLAGAALFYGDAALTPAVSVLSAVEGLSLVTTAFDPYILPIAIAIIIGLFMVQWSGTTVVGRLFGPITLMWFLVIGLSGLMQIIRMPEVLAALNPLQALHFLSVNGKLGLVVLGAVFLAVTGADALYADMGHFGRRPIQ